MPTSYAGNLSSTKRFSIVTETYPPEINGVANSLQQLAIGLHRKGHQVQIIRPRQHAQDTNGMHECGLEHVTMPGLPLPGYHDLKFGVPLAQTFSTVWRQNPPDAIYVATEGPLGLVACNVAKQLQIPVLTGFHTNFHQYSHYYHVGWLEPLISGYLRWFHNRTTATLTPTKKMRDQLDAMGIVNSVKLSRGVDCQRFNPAERCQELRRTWGAATDTPVVLYGGRLAAEKNITLAITAFNAIQERHRNARFVLVGDGPLRRELQEKHPHFIFCGMQTGNALARHFASGDIFLFPSKTDTFGNVVTEALASGLGIVAFDDAAANEHISHGVNGFKVPLGDDQAFVAAAITLFEERDTLVKIRHAARDHALSIQWPHIIDQFESLLLTSRPSAAPENFFRFLPRLQG